MVGRLEAKIEEIKEKRILLTKEAQQLQNSCTRVTEKTKLLQEQIERDISARYSNRRCNILGGVQSLTKL
jgi:FtsZ-binding cell division protein ZapB